MKKLIFMYSFVFLLAVLLLCGCGGITDTDTETSTDSDTATEAVDSSTDTPSDTDTNTDTSSDTDTNTDTSSDTDTNVDTSSDTDTNTNINVELYEKYGNKIYFEYEEKDIYYPEIREYEKVSNCFEIPLDEQGFKKVGAYLKFIATYEELLQYIAPTNFDSSIFDLNYVVCVKQYFYDDAHENRLIGYYDLNCSNGTYNISLDHYKSIDQVPHEQSADPYEFTTYIIVSKNSIEYSEQLQQITVNGRNYIDYEIIYWDNSGDLVQDDIEDNGEQVNASIHKLSHYYITHNTNATLPEAPTAWVIEKGSELENFYGLEYYNKYSEINFRVVLYLPNEPKCDFIITEKEIKNGNLYLTVEMYSQYTNEYLNKNDVKFYDLYIQDSSELSENFDVYILVKQNLTVDNQNNSSNLSVAEKRNLKVSFDMEPGDFGGVLDGRLIAVMGENEDGNTRIEYSPNAYQFYVLVTCQDELNEALSVVEAQIEEYFDGYAYGGSPTTVIDVIKNSSSNTVTVLFPDFDSYYLCQENMLNGLSEKDSVLSVEIGYFDIQNGTRKPKNTYEYINVGRAFEENRYIASYNEFVSLLGNRIENDEELQQITEQTFEDNYVFVVVNLHHREFDISDAKLIGNTVYFTTNCYGINGELVPAMEYINACITLVPKTELGELPQEISVRGLKALLLIDE